MKITWEQLKPFILLLVAGFMSLGGWFGNTLYSQVTTSIQENKTQIRTIAEIQIETVVKLASIVKENESQTERLRGIERRLRGNGVQDKNKEYEN